MSQDRVALLGIPVDVNSSFLRGAAGAPARIREALASAAGNAYSENGTDTSAVLEDRGDLEPQAKEPSIRAAVQRILEDGSKPLLLGGDHSITDPIVQTFEGYLPALDIVHFDAHADLYDDFEGNRSSHACPFARIMERGHVSRLVQIGIRTLNRHQREQAERFGVEVIEMCELGPARSLVFDNPLYLSIDLDVLDPAFAPGLSHREPGGMSTRQLIDWVQKLSGTLVGADIVELNPDRDVDGATAGVAAKLVKEVTARLASS